MKKFILLLVCAVSHVNALHMIRDKACDEIAQLSPHDLLKLQRSELLLNSGEITSELRKRLSKEKRYLCCLKMVTCSTGNETWDYGLNFIKVLFCSSLPYLFGPTLDFSSCRLANQLLENNRRCGAVQSNSDYTYNNELCASARASSEAALAKSFIITGVTSLAFPCCTYLYHRKAKAAANTQYILTPNSDCPSCNSALESWHALFLDASGVMRHARCESKKNK